MRAPSESRSTADRGVVYALGIGLLGVMAMAAYKFDLHAGWFEKQTAAPVAMSKLTP